MLCIHGTVFFWGGTLIFHGEKNIYIFLISNNFITYYKQFQAIIIFVVVILMVFTPMGGLQAYF